MVCKRSQHVGPNNAASCWPTMLRAFARAFKSDVISVEKWEAGLSMMERRLKEAEEEIGQWREKYQNLEKEKVL